MRLKLPMLILAIIGAATCYSAFEKKEDIAVTGIHETEENVSKMLKKAEKEIKRILRKLSLKKPNMSLGREK